MEKLMAVPDGCTYLGGCGPNKVTYERGYFEMELAEELFRKKNLFLLFVL